MFLSEYGGSGPLRFAKPQSCKASLALHASKLQSLKAAKPLWRLTPQSLKAPKPLWRLTPQSLKASKLQSLFGASRFKASKPQSLNAWMLWRFGALALGALDALVPLGPLALCGSLTLWRFLALWDFAALWRFGTLQLFETCHLGGKKWFCRFYFFSSTDWNIGIKAVSEKKQRARLFVFEGQRSPAASELTTTCLVIFVGCLMMVYLSRWLTSVVCKSPFRGS